MNDAGEPFDRSAEPRIAERVEAPHGYDVSGAGFVAGQLIAERFSIQRLAGRGGMGTVYRAIDLTTNMPVAVKCVGRTSRASGERFAREATMLAQLSHPAVVRYVAHGITERETQFLAMEWLDGEDLGKRLSTSGLDVAETISMSRRICEGLSAAHALGMIHRDIKPNNIFLVGSRAEAAKLLDFGVARQGEQGSAQTLTRAGTVIGTVGYMAPEQAMGLRDVDARADLFALGCVMFECLTGHPAFHGPHDVAVLSKVLCDDAPRVRDLRPDIGESLDDLVASLLTKDRSSRPSDARAVLQAIDELGDQHGIGAPPVRKPSGPKLVAFEQKIASVLIARPYLPASATLTSDEAELAASEFDALLRRFSAEPVPLRAGQFLLVFGSAQGIVASDQAVQAVRCALRMHRLKPGLGIAVATGGLEHTLDASVGVAIDRAAALLDGQTEDMRQLLVDELTAGLLDSRFELERRSAGAFAVLSENDESERPRLLLGKPSLCVGREKELGLLDATLAEAIDDEVARVLLVTAEPGMGKSRLAREFLVRLHGKPVRTLFARADPMARGSGWGVVQRLLSHTFGLREGDAAAFRQQRLREYLEERVDASTLAWLSEFLGELIGAPVERAPSALLLAARDDPAVMREQTRRAAQHWLTTEVARSPLLILLEDLHWADLPSVSLLEDALLALAERPLFLLAFARPDVHEHFPSLWQSIGCQEYHLQGLTRRAAERLIRSTLPTQVDRSIIERILDLAQGNAFYLEELLRHVSHGESELPETVRAMAQSRLERHSPEARRHMRAASVFGEASWVGAVGALLGGADQVSEEFRQLAHEEIFVQHTEARFAGEIEYAFRHALLRDAAYAMLTDDDRRRAHGLAADWLQAAGERDPCVLADHLERCLEPERALPFLLRAARAALGSGDLSGAVLLARRGLRLGPSGRERGDLLLVQAHASAWGTQTNLELAEEALSLFAPGTSSWWFSLALMVFGASAIGRGGLAEPYLELARHAQPPADERLGMHGQAFEVLALGAGLLGRADIGWAMLDKLRPVVSRLPATDTLPLAWLNVAECHLSTNSLRAGEWRLEHAVRVGEVAVMGMREVAALHGEGTARLHLGMTFLELGRYEDAERMFNESLRQTIQTGNVLIAEFSRLMLVLFALRQGRTEDGLAALDSLARSSDANVVHAVRAVRAEAYFRTGKLDEALAVASASVEGPGLIYRLTSAITLARTLRAQRQPERALRVVEQAIASRGPASFPQFEVDLQSLRAELTSALGRTEDAAAAAQRALRFAATTAALIEDEQLRASFLQKLRLSPRLQTLASGG
jgi:eukaryotic-like serine/threonine-protein kinase